MAIDMPKDAPPEAAGPIPGGRVIAVLEDLLFTVKILDGAKRGGLSVEFSKTTESVLEKLAAGPALVVIDLNFQAIAPLDLVRRLKALPEPPRLLAFVSHVQVELRERALQAGCDAVVPRSAFSKDVTGMLQKHAGLS